MESSALPTFDPRSLLKETTSNREPLTISRWERSETEIDANAETLIRLHAIERLKLEVEDGISEISGWSVPSAVRSRS